MADSGSEDSRRYDLQLPAQIIIDFTAGPCYRQLNTIRCLRI